MIKSLKQRLALLLILPVALLLSLTGVSGFIYVRNAMLKEWREAAVLKLERAAHRMDMRIDRPMAWIRMFNQAADGHTEPIAREWILNQLKNLEGVMGVRLELPEHRLNSGSSMNPAASGAGMGHKKMMQFHQGWISEVTPPRYDARTGQKTVTLISDLKDDSGKAVARLEVDLSFNYLMQDITKFGWWQSDLACLVDESGRYLAHSKGMKERIRLGETDDPVELAVLEMMRNQPFGTYLSPEHPPKMVSGFYRMKQAPWVIAMFAPGEKILSPIIEFRSYFIVAGGFCVALILILIQLVGGKMVHSIREISDAAGHVAVGNYGKPLKIETSDEIGRLKASFNAMVEGLKEKDFIRDTFGRYMDHEIAKELLKHPEAGRMGGVKREVAILMSDIRGFTPISESLSPEQTIRLLNHYFSALIQVAQKHKGIIVDFYGDGVLIFFDPLDGPVDPVVRQAVGCALEMQKEMKHLNAQMREKHLPELQTGIGVNVGEVVVGNIGSEARAKYGIVGSAVNVTQRIQSQAGGGEVVVSDAVYDAVRESVNVKKSFSAPLKGVNEKMDLHVVEKI
jgi:class 3 adenylate cyclase